MSGAAKETRRIKGRIAPFVVLVVASLMIALFMMATSSEAFANELHNSQIDTQQYVDKGDSDTEDEEADESQGYKVYTFDSQDIIDAQTNQSGTIIPDSDVPLTSTLMDSKNSTVGVGSIFNTVIVALCALSMLLMFALIGIRKTKDYRVITVRTLAAAAGLVTIVSWSLMDRLQTPTLVFNDSSAFIAALFSIYVVLAAYSYIYEARLDKQSKQVEKPSEGNTPASL